MTDCQNGKDGKDLVSAAAAARVVDANFNRADEGLRVVEEYARFVLGDAFLARRLKETRHRLTTALALDMAEHRPLAYRDTQQDVGTAITTDSESHRPNVESVARANFRRVMQALRALEEYGKILSTPFALACEAMRYELYTLEQATLGSQRKNEILSRARVYVLVDGMESIETFERTIAAIVTDADVIQLRDKKLADRELLQRAHRLRAMTRGIDCLFIMNDRPDLAALAGADGVHVGQEEIGVAEVRKLVGERAVIGVSTHNLGQLQQAVLDGASYIGCGPVFPSGTKPFAKFPGLEFLRAAANETSLPAFAIGGIDLDNLDQVIEAGFQRVAIQGALSRSGSAPKEVLGSFKARLSARATSSSSPGL